MTENGKLAPPDAWTRPADPQQPRGPNGAASDLGVRFVFYFLLVVPIPLGAFLVTATRSQPEGHSCALGGRAGIRPCFLHPHHVGVMKPPEPGPSPRCLVSVFLESSSQPQRESADSLQTRLRSTPTAAQLCQPPRAICSGSLQTGPRGSGSPLLTAPREGRPRGAKAYA